MTLFRNWTVVCGVALCCSLVGCGGGKGDFKSASQLKEERPDAGKKKKKDDHGHHHHAPHHGSLTMYGDHYAQIELTVDPEVGKLTVYVHDGNAENTLLLDQENLELNVTPEGSTEPIALKLVPADPAKQQDGFVVQHDKLKGVKALEARIVSLKTKAMKIPEKLLLVEFDAKQAEVDAEEAHKAGHEDHDGHEHGKSDAKASDSHDHDEKGHDHDAHDHAKKDAKASAGDKHDHDHDDHAHDKQDAKAGAPVKSDAKHDHDEKDHDHGDKTDATKPSKDGKAGADAKPGDKHDEKDHEHADDVKVDEKAAEKKETKDEPAVKAEEKTVPN